MHRIYRDRQWMGMAALFKLCIHWFRLALTQGAKSWDRTIYTVFSVVLQSATAARAGDLALSRGYRKEFMAWKDLTVKLTKDASVSNLELIVRLRFVKGQKYVSILLLFVSYLCVLDLCSIKICIALLALSKVPKTAASVASSCF